jgi:hypothetical protein
MPKDAGIRHKGNLHSELPGLIGVSNCAEIASVPTPFRFGLPTTMSDATACRLCNLRFYSHPEDVSPDLCALCKTPCDSFRTSDFNFLGELREEDESDDYVYPSAPDVYKGKASGRFTESKPPFQHPGRNTLVATSDPRLQKPPSSLERTENQNANIYISNEEDEEDEEDEELDYDRLVEVALAKFGMAMPRDDEPFKINEEGLLESQKRARAAIDKENAEWKEYQMNRVKQDERMSELREKVFEAIVDGVRSGEISATFVDSIEIECA